MATLDITKVKSDLGGIIGGANLSKIKSINPLFERAARNLLSKIDPLETMRRTEVTLFNEVYDYASFSDLKSDDLIDIRPQVERQKNQNFRKRGIKTFDLEKEDFTYAIEHRNSNKILRVVRKLSNNIVVHQLSTISGNGTWSAGGGASNLAEDSITKARNFSSLRFDIGSTGGNIENSDLNAVDLSNHEDKSTLFLWVYLPDASIITNIDLRWGSSSSAYWNRTVTAPHFGSFVNGWNLVSFAWNGATETGSPDSSAVNYSRINITSTSSDTDIRVNYLVSRIGEIHQALYYSNYLFRSEGSETFKENVENDNDRVNLGIVGFNIYVYECVDLIGEQLRNPDIRSEAKKTLYGDGRPEFPGLYSQYRAENPEQEEVQSGFY